MIIELWMDDLAEEAPAHHNKVGAVLVSPNDVIMAADCSRYEVHAVARLLTKHHDKAEGCEIFISRKPCSCCAKILVESKVKRVLYLPFEPEYYRYSGKKQETQFNAEQMKQVDTLFTTSAIVQTKFVPQIEDPVIDYAKNSVEENGVNKETYKTEFNRLMEKYSALKENSRWMSRVKQDLPWPELNKRSKEEMRTHFEKIMEWIAIVLVQSGQREVNLYNAKTNDSFEHTKRDQRFMEIVRFLAQRSDDPQTGTVIVSPENVFLPFGWHGFFLKEKLARDSKSDEKVPDKKYPYVNHAEQNALLVGNTQSLKDAILYVTKSPCDECTPLIAAEGIKTVFVDDDVKRREQLEWDESDDELGYNWFVDKIDDGTFTCYKNQLDKTMITYDKEHSDE